MLSGDAIIVLACCIDNIYIIQITQSVYCIYINHDLINWARPLMKNTRIVHYPVGEILWTMCIEVYKNNSQSFDS